MNIQHLVLNSKTRRRNLTKIRERRFRNSSKLKTVQIHKNSGINCIGEEAFQGCTSLRSVHLAESVERIELGAFYACVSLKSVHLTRGIEIIEEKAFRGCTLLQSIRIPAGVERIEKQVFYNCTSLQSIHMNIAEDSDGVKVKSIENSAFFNCSSLRSIHVPQSITTIGAFAFCNCTSLHSISIPCGVMTIEAFTFSGCTLLQSVNIPNTVTTIGYCAFDGCTSLQSFHIQNTVRNIGERAFKGCIKLNQRKINAGPNYDPDIDTWLRRRFDNLPIHSACYYAEDTLATVNLLSTLIQDNKKALSTTDAMGMTPLHILCFNPRATFEMVQIMVENDPSLLNRMDVTGSTPLQLFLKCRRLLGTAEDLLKNGVNSKDLEVLFILNDNQEFVTSWRTQDGSTNLFPFMTAATLSSCGLDVVYSLAMKNLDAIV